jgi:chromosome segregation ATPase
MRSILLIAILMTAFVSTQDPSIPTEWAAKTCEPGMSFTFSDVDASCKGVFEGVKIEDWNEKVNTLWSDMNNLKPGDDDVNFKWNCDSSSHNCKFAFDHQTDYKTVVFVVQVGNFSSAYRHDCISNENLSGVFDTYGVELTGKRPDHVKSFLAYNKACNAIEDIVIRPHPIDPLPPIDFMPDDESIYDCIDKLKDRIHSLESQNLELVNTVTHLTNENSNLHDRVKDLEEDLDDCNADLDEIIGVNSELQNQIDELFNENDQLSVDLDQCLLDLEAKDGEVIVCEEIVQSTRTNEDAFRERIAELEKLVGTLSGDLAECNIESTRCNAELVKSQEYIKQLENDLKTCKEEVAALLANIPSEIKKAVEALENRIKELEAIIKELRTNIVELNVTIEENNATIEALSSEITSLEWDLEVCEDASLNLSDELEACRATESALESRIESLQNTIARLEQSVEKYNTLITNLNEQIDILKEENEEVANKLEECHTELTCKTRKVEFFKNEFNIFLMDFETCEKDS